MEACEESPMPWVKSARSLSVDFFYGSCGVAAEVCPPNAHIISASLCFLKEENWWLTGNELLAV